MIIPSMAPTVMNYHSRTPFLSMQNTANGYAKLCLASASFNGRRTAMASFGHVILASPPGAASLGMGRLRAAMLVGNGNYFMDYPEDIRLYGLSFSTTLPTGTAWQGEISYRPNMPVQINTQDMTLKLATGIGGSLAVGNVAGALAQGGRFHRGYDRKEVTQIQTTFTHFFDQVLGASRATVVGEVGLTHVGGLG